MEIIHIFGHNLFAVKYEGEEKNEFSRLFEIWQDPEFLEDFFETNKADLENYYGQDISIEGATFETYKYAQELEGILLDLEKKNEKEQLSVLEEIFSPLSKSFIETIILQKSKAKRNWLRIYALRVEKNVYIITGGAIKLTQKMQDRKHTSMEIRKIESCRRFLLDHDIVTRKEVIEVITNN
jgi:hypothetical protein